MDYSPPEPEDAPNETSWLLVRCQYGSLCASILRECYSQRSLQRPNPNSVTNLEEQLQDWVWLLPPGLQPMECSAAELAVTSPQERRIRLRIFFQYYEALLTIHSRRWSHCSSDIPNPYSSSDQKREWLVRKILVVGGQLTASDVRSDP